MGFHVGQRVECVRDGWSPNCFGYLPPFLPRQGVVYVVRAVGFGQFGIAIRLHWLVNPPVPLTEMESQFAVTGCDDAPNFRPIVEIETDISVFTRMLTPSPKQTEKV